jgi:hypothetical protein
MPLLFLPKNSLWFWSFSWWFLSVAERKMLNY